jgi:putative transposase
MGTRRFVYNRVLGKLKSKEESKIDAYKLISKYVISKNNPLVNEWETETPKDIRAGAVRDLVKNYTSAISRIRKRQIRGFNMKFCSKKDNPSIEIPHSAIKLVENKEKTGKDLYIYKTYIKDPIKIAKGEKLDFEIKHGCRLQIVHNKWFLCVPITIPKKTDELKTEKKQVCSLDPGVRTFQTVYSEDSVSQIKINKELIDKLQFKLDHFKSLRDRKIIKNKRFKRREKKIYFRLDNLINDLHFKTINYLTNTFQHIIIPKFESQELSKKIRCKNVNRNLLQLRHFQFRQRLESKCRVRKCTLDVCTEEYTSKTCGRCGNVANIGSNDVYKCKKCDLVIDRDVNGARNIMIKRINELL